MVYAVSEIKEDWKNSDELVPNGNAATVSRKVKKDFSRKSGNPFFEPFFMFSLTGISV